MRRLLLAGAVLALASCKVGSGWGLVEGCIHMPACSVDPDGEPFETCTEETYDYTFRPDFFSGQIHEDGSLTITAQKGGYRIGESDGIVISVPDYGWVADQLEGVEEAGFAIPPGDELESLPMAERFKISAYLNGSCPSSEVSFNEGVGEIRFLSMCQSTDHGDARDEPRIHLTFDAEFVDPWPYAEPQPDSPRLVAHGEIRFDYERGSPAQPFP
jgi:hypothetical protein